MACIASAAVPFRLFFLVLGIDCSWLSRIPDGRQTDTPIKHPSQHHDDK
jgi:hypothetical protein